MCLEPKTCSTHIIVFTPGETTCSTIYRVREGVCRWWQVILVCSEEDSLSAEMQLLHAVHAAVAEDGRAHVMVYAADQACKMEVWH